MKDRAKAPIDPSCAGPPRRRATVGACAAALLLGMAAGGCSGDDGSSSQSKTVAVVDGTPITQAKFDRLIRQVTASYATARGYPGKRYYVPPAFPLCVRDLRLRAQSVPAVRARCKGRYAELRETLLTGMIEAEWLEQGARKRGIRIPLARVRSELDVPDAAREAPAHRLTRLSISILRDGTTRYPFTPSRSAVEQYYSQNAGYFVQPPSRIYVGMGIASRARAVRAARALRGGRSWDDVAKRYAIARAPDRPGAATRSLVDPSMVARVFGAREGTVVGPFATGGATWYVLTVKRIVPSFRMTFEQARKPIKSFLAQDIRRDVRLDFWRRFRERARAHTRCLTDLKVRVCDNGPRADFEPYGALHDPVPGEPRLPAPNEVIAER